MSERALSLLHALVLEDGRRWGDAAADFQREDAAAILDEDAPPYTFVTRSRGGSKTGDLAGVTIATLLSQLPDGSRAYGVAADVEQARLLLHAIGGYARRTPELRGALRIEAHRVIAVRSGSRFETLPADGPSAWGLLPAFVVADELAQWPETAGAREVWEAVTSAVAKVARARLVVLTTAGSPSHWSRGVLDHALADPMWCVHEVPGPAPWLDPARLDEQRRRLTPSLYARLFENVWTDADDALATMDELRQMATLDGPQEPQRGRSYCIGLDVGLTNDRTVACVAHVESGVVVVDRMAVWQGTRAQPVQLGEVEEYVARLARDYRAPVIFDPYQAVQLAQNLERRGVRTRKFTFSSQSVGRIASTLVHLLRELRLRLPDDAALLDELARVRLRELSPGVVRIDHRPGEHDDRVIALGLVAHRLVERGDRRSATWHSPLRLVERPARHDYPPTTADGAPVARVPPSAQRRRAARIVGPACRPDRIERLAAASGLTVWDSSRGFN